MLDGVRKPDSDRVRICEHPWHKTQPPTTYRERVWLGRYPIVVVSELAGNRGASVTNNAEAIWFQSRGEWSGATVIEHYGPESYDKPDGHVETFDLLFVEEGVARWRALTPLVELLTNGR